MGLHRAGFEVVGVDWKRQSNYRGGTFKLANALTYPLEGYDLIWASPPCQAYTAQGRCRPGYKYPSLISEVRERLRASGTPYIIENVVGAPLENWVMLCGAMFGCRVYRHRWFESSLNLLVPPHIPHRDRTPKSGRGEISPKGFISVAGHFSNVAYVKVAMDCEWMTRDELSQAIPPAYSEFLGRQVIEQLRRAA